MKSTKRLLALLLIFALAFTLALPVFAEDEPDPAMPVITVQPQGERVLKEDLFLVKKKAHIPNGDEIGYQWYRNNTLLDGATGDSIIGNARETADYYVIAYNKANPELNVKSETARVVVYVSFFLKMFNYVMMIFNPMFWFVLLIAPFGLIASLFNK